MAKKRVSDSALKKVEKQDKRNKDFKVREGKPNDSLSINKKGSDEDTYPHAGTADKQLDNQPEFISRDNSESMRH